MFWGLAPSFDKPRSFVTVGPLSLLPIGNTVTLPLEQNHAAGVFPITSLEGQRLACKDNGLNPWMTLGKEVTGFSSDFVSFEYSF